MKQRATATVALALAAAAWSGPASAVDAAAVTGKDAYNKAVPQHLRDLVSLDAYNDAATTLAGADRLDLSAETVRQAAGSPCHDSLAGLVNAYSSKKRVRAALDTVAAKMRTPPTGYGDKAPGPANRWDTGGDGVELVRRMLPYFTDWCTFLPRINGSHDNGLAFIEGFAWFYYRNPAGIAFVQGRDPNNPDRELAAGKRFTEKFTAQRGTFMDSPASTKHIESWIDDPRVEIEDYRRTRASQYESWNDFFARNLKVDREAKKIPSRPVTMPERDYVVSSPTDCVINPLTQVLKAKDGGTRRRYIQNPLQEDMIIDVKNQPIPLMDLLGDVPKDIRRQFVGGTGLSCVLMPNTYHHYHTPVSGKIVHKQVIPENTYGYPDFPNWLPLGGDVGRPGADFTPFTNFQRGVIVIKVQYEGVDGGTRKGYVASIPVGLNTVGSVVLNDKYQEGDTVKRGYSRLGKFVYGGALNILLFSKGLAPGVVQTRLGQQITQFNMGRPAPDPLPDVKE